MTLAATMPRTRTRAQTTELTVRLPRPHAAQAYIKKHAGKRNVICAGRRAGKTTLAAIVAVEQLLAGRRVLLAAPTQEQVDAFWEYAKSWLHPLVAAGLIYKNETTRVLEFSAVGGRLKAKTAWNADTLRGDYADFMVLDEFAMMKPDTWTLVAAPMLLDNDGECWFISTPRRRNHFYQHFQRAKDDGDRWRAFHFKTEQNPYLSVAALTEITADMSTNAYRQEILAEFLEGEGQVFRNIDACLTAPTTTPAKHVGHHIVIGVDWGKKQDYTVISVFCADCAQEVELDRFNKVDYTLQRGRLSALWRKWSASYILAESNAMGEPIIDQLRLEGLPVIGFQTTAASKPALIEALALAFERGEARWLDHAAGRDELGAYERRESPTTGRPTYSAPPGSHDDIVIARALAWRATAGPTAAQMVAFTEL